jgi:hypothetical protein
MATIAFLQKNLGLDRDPSELVSEHWKTALGVCLVLTPLVNYTYMTIRTQLALRSKTEGRDAPELPYFIPYLGHLLSVAYDAHGFLNKVM